MHDPPVSVDEAIFRLELGFLVAVAAVVVVVVVVAAVVVAVATVVTALSMHTGYVLLQHAFDSRFTLAGLLECSQHVRSL